MKRLITGALALVLFMGAAQAQAVQDTSRHQHRADHQMAMKQLNLTSDQQAQLRSIRENQRKEMEALRSNKALTTDQLKEQRKALHKKYSEQFRSVLTPAQKDQMKQLQAQRKGKEGKKAQWKKGERKDFARKGAGFQNELNLTQSQKDQLAKMRTESRSQMQSIRNDQSLSQEQKKEKMHSLMKDQKEKFKSVLTKEQVEKLQALKKERRSKNTK